MPTTCEQESGSHTGVSISTPRAPSSRNEAAVISHTATLSASEWRRPTPPSRCAHARTATAAAAVAAMPSTPAGAPLPPSQMR